MTERFQARFAPGNGLRIAEMLADDISSDDRRRVVGAGVRHGRDARWRTFGRSPNSGYDVTRSVIATRGSDLVLVRLTFSRRAEGS